MTFFLTGAGGQVGREFVRLAGPHDVVALDRAALDITDAAAVRKAVAAARPDVVVNAAAYTAVDRAEAEPEAAFAVNRDGARHVAAAAAAVGAPIVHLSTDYVFDGTKGAPYAPDDPTSPLGVYGASKAAGEAAVRSAAPASVILRTAWVFSAYDANFVATILRLAAERPRLTVVADQWGHPTAARDVARAAHAAARRALDGLVGTVHAAGAPLATWHELATATVDAAADAGHSFDVEVAPIPTADYPTAARRPERVELELGPSLDALGLGPLDWRPALRDAIRERLATMGGRS
ncbi:dTDP-4-dehydrorhamnose reductase [Rubrivirga marina]|uniref:dTDP-4-dehydrorhamnose reductase n=1 Tax=Rubrivirga marina TaxID=1196024 RepID=A0A271IZ96_9BACT|nr:dTDP-4-dehydrorhamnose reductase [Rubrivirga marina]PAP76397.1 dTDP-4-dehydrorhamnose reductase [Rubrivirga marina]